MALKLNTTTSIVDFLKSQGKASDFGSRESLYNSLGMGNRLGKYTGSSDQNVAFLKSLQTPTAPSAAQPIPTGNTPTPITNEGTQQQSGTGTTGPQPEATIGSSGMTASAALSSIPGVPSTDEILGKVFSSPGFQNFQMGQEAQNAYDIGSAAAEKEKLAGEAVANTQKFIDNMGRRGLFFSGETQSGIQSLIEGLAVSKLGVDRELANDLLQRDVKTRDTIMKEVENVVKDAQRGRADAISSLEKVGLTVIGDKVVPTLEAERLALSRASEQRLQESAELKRELDLAKFEVNQAKSAQQMEMAAARLELAQARFENSQNATSAAEKKASAAVQLYSPTISTAIDSGYAPEDALAAAVEQASLSGVVLGIEEQNAIVQEATRQQGVKQSSVKSSTGNKNETISRPEDSATSYRNPVTSFFSRLRGY